VQVGHPTNKPVEIPTAPNRFLLDILTVRFCDKMNMFRVTFNPTKTESVIPIIRFSGIIRIEKLSFNCRISIGR
jgi:hypothetical protein